jgi:hypothetical protein
MEKENENEIKLNHIIKKLKKCQITSKDLMKVSSKKNFLNDFKINKVKL